MADSGLQLTGEAREIDCVEIYLPKSIEFLSELYQFLREKITNRLGPAPLNGLSIYEVDGIFSGERLWEQRTLVIRLLFLRPRDARAPGVESRVNVLGKEIANKVAGKEEEIWICHYPVTLSAFAGAKRLLK